MTSYAGETILSEIKTFSDELIACQACGKTFVFRVSEQRRMYASQGEVTVPVRCPACREESPETHKRRGEAPEAGKRRGEVKWFNVEKGYGFIRKPDGQEIFFHRSSLLSASPWEVFEGQAVRFEEEETARGPQAVAVELID